MTTNILYIHGYGGDGNSRTAQTLRTYLPENYTVFSPCFPLNPAEALELIREIIIKEKIDIVVASSLGAFTALRLNVHKIVINTCLYPSKELPKRNEISEDILLGFAEFEKNTFAEICDYDKEYTIGVFSTNDELFSYKDEFRKHYSKVITIEDTHRISVENVEKVIVPMVQALQIINLKNKHHGNESKEINPRN